MKTLSLREPWATLVVHFGKWVENRSWNTAFRGEFLVHAAKGMTRREFDEAYFFAACALGPALPHEATFRSMLQFCTGDYLRCVCRGKPWHMGDRYGFLLADVRPVPFRPCRGRLMWFDSEACAGMPGTRP